MTKAKKTLVETVSELGESLTTFGGRLQKLNESRLESGRVPDALVEILDSGSGGMLASAKSFAALGGNATIALGIAASALEETAWAMAREAWWKVSEGLEELADQLQELRNGFASEADVISRCNPDSRLPGLIIDSGASLGAAGHVFRVAAGEVAAGRVNPGLKHLLAAGELLSAVGRGLVATSDGLTKLAVGPWTDDCTCGTFKWEKEGILDKAWVLYECVLEKGTFCNVCVWTAGGREIRYHTEEPDTPEPLPEESEP